MESDKRKHVFLCNAMAPPEAPEEVFSSEAAQEEDPESKDYSEGEEDDDDESFLDFNSDGDGSFGMEEYEEGDAVDGPIDFYDPENPDADDDVSYGYGETGLLSEAPSGGNDIQDDEERIAECNFCLKSMALKYLSACGACQR